MNTIRVTFAIIDKGFNGIPLYIKESLVSYDLVWDYFKNDNDRMENIMKSVLGIHPESPCFVAVFCECLVDPVTGEMHIDGGETREEFMCKVYNRHRELLGTAGFAYLSSGF